MRCFLPGLLQLLQTVVYSCRQTKVRLSSSRSKTSWDNTCFLLRRSVPKAAETEERSVCTDGLLTCTWKNLSEHTSSFMQSGRIHSSTRTRGLLITQIVLHAEWPPLAGQHGVPNAVQQCGAERWCCKSCFICCKSCLVLFVGSVGRVLSFLWNRATDLTMQQQCFY